MQHDIAKSICQGWSPQLREAMELPEQATRLDRALKVAEAWMEAAREDSAEMFAQAQYTHDKLEEELSRVCFEMEVEDRTRLYGEEHTAKAPSDALSDVLLGAYNALREVPAELVGAGSPRARYELMGALLVAMDAANAEMKNLEVEKKATA